MNDRRNEHHKLVPVDDPEFGFVDDVCERCGEDFEHPVHLKPVPGRYQRQVAGARAFQDRTEQGRKRG